MQGQKACLIKAKMLSLMGEESTCEMPASSESSDDNFFCEVGDGGTGDRGRPSDLEFRTI